MKLSLDRKMNGKIETKKMMQFFQTSKCNLWSGLKDMDRSLCNLKLESQNRRWTSQMTSRLGLISSLSIQIRKVAAHWKQMRRLKLEYEKLASEKKCEVSDLSRENGFVWSQLKCMESGFTDKLKKKEDEIAQANV
ncbi:hypothetical protein Bca101_008689 [Brassica carinata]